MIKIVKRGEYRLLEKKDSSKFFSLNTTKTFLWKDNTIQYIDSNIRSDSQYISHGKYFFYEVNNDDSYTDSFHLELHIGNKIWQGYILPDGLPNKKSTTKTMVSTKELITLSRLSV